MNGCAALDGFSRLCCLAVKMAKAEISINGYQRARKQKKSALSHKIQHEEAYMVRTKTWLKI